jgi:hypothetical protein
LNKFKFQWPLKLIHSIVVGQNVDIQIAIPTQEASLGEKGMKWRIWDGAQGWSKAEQCKEVTINKETVCNQHQEWCGQSSWWVLIISHWEKINGSVDHECKLMQIVQVAQGAVNRNVAWPMVYSCVISA